MTNEKKESTEKKEQPQKVTVKKTDKAPEKTRSKAPATPEKVTSNKEVKKDKPSPKPIDPRLNWNVRRLVGSALLLVLGALGFAQLLAPVGKLIVVRTTSARMVTLFLAAWSEGLGIWYICTLRNLTRKKTERIVRILFVCSALIYFILVTQLKLQQLHNYYCVAVIIAYLIGTPWGHFGYSKHPYLETQSDLYEKRA